MEKTLLSWISIKITVIEGLVLLIPNVFNRFRLVFDSTRMIRPELGLEHQHQQQFHLN